MITAFHTLTCIHFVYCSEWWIKLGRHCECQKLILDKALNHLSLLDWADMKRGASERASEHGQWSEECYLSDQHCWAQKPCATFVLHVDDNKWEVFVMT